MSKHHNVANSEKPRERTLPILIVAILFLEFRLPLQPRTQHHRPVICRKPLDCLDPCTLHGTLFSTFPQAAQFARRLPLHDAHSATCWAYSTPLTHRVASSTGIMTNFFFFFWTTPLPHTPQTPRRSNFERTRRSTCADARAMLLVNSKLLLSVVAFRSFGRTRPCVPSWAGDPGGQWQCSLLAAGTRLFRRFYRNTDPHVGGVRAPISRHISSRGHANKALCEISWHLSSALAEAKSGRFSLFSGR